jgi:hypothetical protein
MKTLVGQNAQPLNAGFHAYRRMERDISEMLGLATGILGDGRADDSEVKYLRKWFDAHHR